MRTLSSHHAAFLAKFRCSLYRGLSTSISSMTFSASKQKSPTKNSSTPDDRQVPSRAFKRHTKFSHSRRSPQMPSPAVKCDKTFSHSRRSPSAFSLAQTSMMKIIQPLLPTIAKCLLAPSSVTKHSATSDDRQEECLLAQRVTSQQV